MPTFRFSFQPEPDQEELLLAWLSDLPFHAFEQEENRVIAFLNADEVSEALLREIDALKGVLPFEYEYQTLPDQNWNQIWESNFQPIRIGNFCQVRADFHTPAPEVQHDLLINPEMAFGTGHHATTYMMIQLMEELDFRHKKVLDYGCGTGILAILAARMGARTIDAIDIEFAAFENTQSNIKLNQTSQVIPLHGTLDDIEAEDYNIILANINRNVILASLPALKKKITTAGHLLLSGILQSDRELVEQRALACGFQYTSHLTRGDWVAIRMSA